MWTYRYSICQLVWLVLNSDGSTGSKHLLVANSLSFTKTHLAKPADFRLHPKPKPGYFKKKNELSAKLQEKFSGWRVCVTDTLWLSFPALVSVGGTCCPHVQLSSCQETCLPRDVIRSDVDVLFLLAYVIRFIFREDVLPKGESWPHFMGMPQ